jgi:hypothetical protein
MKRILLGSAIYKLPGASAMKQLIIALFLAVPLFANQPVVLEPPAPTSKDPIEFQITVLCGGTTLSTNRVGSVIKIEIEALDVLCSPPIQTVHAMRIDPLPPGRYRVEIFKSHLDGVYATREFFVRSATKTLDVHPSVLPVNQTSLPRVRIQRPDYGMLCHGTCPGVTVRVGGVAATDVRADELGIGVWFTPPAHSNPELVDIDIQYGDAIQKYEHAIAYAQPDDPSLYERILFPVLDEVRGVNGSHWISEAAVANPNRWYVENANNIQPIVCLTFPCGTQRLAPVAYSSFAGAGYPRGALLLVPREEASTLSFSLRVRDTSRVKETFGTQIPVVRERDMQRTTLALLDVPRDPAYRVKLRLYVVQPYGEETPHSWLHIWNPATRTFEMLSATYELPRVDDRPGYVEIDLPPGAVGDRSAIYIEPAFNTRSYAFATITNNETQQVTIITPSGEGSTPCFHCREP